MTRIQHILPEALISRRDNITDYDTHFVLVVRLFVFPLLVLGLISTSVSALFALVNHTPSRNQQYIHGDLLSAPKARSPTNNGIKKQPFDQPTEDAQLIWPYVRLRRHQHDICLTIARRPEGHASSHRKCPPYKASEYYDARCSSYRCMYTFIYMCKYTLTCVRFYKTY